MAKDQKIVRRAFNAGEVSPQFLYRNDTEKHAFACSKLSNFYVSPIGGISRRTGTKLIDVIGIYDSNSNSNHRIIPFEYNRDLSYVLNFNETNPEIEEITLETGRLPSGSHPYSICFTIPKDYDQVKTILELKPYYETINSGIFKVERKADSKLYFHLSSDLSLTSGSLDASLEHSVCCSFDLDGNFKVYIDAELVINTSNCPNITLNELSNTKLVFTGSETMGDNWNLKFFDMDMADSNAYYSASDYNNAELENLEKYLDFDNITTVNGSTVTVGNNVTYSHYNARDITITKIIPAEEETIQDDYICIPINVPFGATLKTFGFEAGDLNEACQVYLGNSDNPSSSLESGGYIYNGTVGTTNDFPFEAIGEDCNSLIIKIHLSTFENSTFNFGMISEFHSVLTNISQNWTTNKSIEYSAYTRDGVNLFKNKETPLKIGILNDMQYKQVNGYIYFTHSKMKPKRLKLDGNGNFIWEEAVYFEPSKEEDENVILTLGDLTKSSKILYANDTNTITANKEYFDLGMVGMQFKIEYTDKGNHTYKWPFRASNNGKSDGYYIGATTSSFPSVGKITVKPEGGIWDGILILEESIDNGNTWCEIGRSSAIAGSENTQFEREIYNVQSVVRAKLLEQANVVDTSSTVVESSEEGCFFNIYSNSSTCVWFEILSVSSDGRTANVKFLNPSRAYWVSNKVYKSAWSDNLGYPRAVDIHEERLTLGGTKSKPSTVWLSQTNNWDNFRSVSNLDTDPLSYTLASDEGEPISWIVSKSDLMIGLGTSEWSLGSRDASQSLTASIVKASNQSQDGVEYVLPAKAANMVIYVRRGNRELGSISYDFASDAYNSISLTTMCPEILGDGVKSIFNQLSPKNYIWAIRNDGVCAVFTYDRENNVSAWSRFLFGDGVISACPISTGQYRSVFLLVERNGFICLERLDPNEMSTNNWVDCVPINDGVEIPNGLETSVRYSSEVETTPIFSEGNVKVSCIELMMINSYGGKYRLNGYTSNGERFENEADWHNIAMKSFDLIANPTPKTYRFVGNCDSGFLEECSIEIKTDEPAPFTLCAIAVKAGGF